MRTDGILACWGANIFVQPMPPAGTFSQVSAGLFHTCALRTDGTVACWGYFRFQYGQATPPAGTFSQVSAGDYHTCGVRMDGTLACWGANWDGQASPPTPTPTATPTRRPGVGGIVNLAPAAVVADSDAPSDDSGWPAAAYAGLAGTGAAAGGILLLAAGGLYARRRRRAS